MLRDPRFSHEVYMLEVSRLLDATGHHALLADPQFGSEALGHWAWFEFQKKPPTIKVSWRAGAAILETR